MSILSSSGKKSVCWLCVKKFLYKLVTKKADGFWQRWQDFFPEQEFEKFCNAQNSSLPKTIRVNLLRNSVEEFLDWVKKHHPDWQLTEHRFGKGIFLIDRADRKAPLGNTIGHAEGRFYIQESSSCLPPLALKPQPGETVLDMAAAPGSKSTQLAAMMNGNGTLVANELVTSRVKKLVFNLERCGVPNALVTSVDGTRFGEALPEFFDAILLDVPCTGEGTFRKDREALDLWSLARIEEAAYLQEKLLSSAWNSLTPGGRIVYSTCTLAPEENERVIARFLAAVGDEAELIDLSRLFVGAEQCSALVEFEGEHFPQLKKALRIWPQLFDSEGFFIAALRKKGDIQKASSASLTLAKKSKEEFLGQKEKDQLLDFFNSRYEFSFPEGYEIIKRESDRRIDYWLVPVAGIGVLNTLPVSRPGIRLAQKHTNNLRLDHEFVIAFGNICAGKYIYEASLSEAQSYFRKENLAPNNLAELPEGDIIVRHDGIPIGISKKVNGVLKNNLPIHFSGSRIT